ncbi:MAG TPA: hypothetical protein VM555_02235 [Tahibacter sp.]|nr:hypothetical protein [Tahibacter sp.]
MRSAARRIAVWVALLFAAGVLAVLWLRWGDAIFAASLGGMVC